MKVPRTMVNVPDKVHFLSQAHTYSEGGPVEVKETHMSWVFLTPLHAWKIKKPVRSEYVDLTTCDARCRNSHEEVRLNRRLAPSVYLGVLPLTIEADGQLALGGNGTPVDWLVKMRRLPSKLMLDEAIANRDWSEDDIRKVGRRLGEFYLQADRVAITGEQYRKQFEEDLDATANELLRSDYKLQPDLVRAQTGRAMSFIRENAGLLNARAESQTIVEAHGDLRPEHICLEAEPVIVDCLEFSRQLRLMDPASELVYLDLECRRLGAPGIGPILFDVYRELTGDHPPVELLDFYDTYHRCIRAKIAVWHLRDSGTATPATWIARALDYLQMPSRISNSEPPE